MGLGLAIVERIGRVLRADVSVRSRVGRGTVFAIDLPLGDSKRASVDDSSQRRRRVTSLLVGKTVLVLDNDSAALRRMGTQLRTWGLYTLEASSVRGAVAVANAHGQLPYVIVVGDREIDGASNLEAIARVRERFDAQIPAVVLSTQSTEHAHHHTNGYWFLDHPERIDRLRSLLHHVFTAA